MKTKKNMNAAIVLTPKQMTKILGGEEATIKEIIEK